MVNKYGKITQKEVSGMFQDKMVLVPQIWENHCTKIPSDAPDETHAWLGSIPQPRQLLSGRQFQGIYEYSFNLENYAYELSLTIDRDSLADDRTGQWRKKVGQMAVAWANFKNQLFAALLEAGTSNTGYDGAAFYANTHAIGGSTPASNDNLLADATIGDPAKPTETEMQEVLTQMINAIGEMPDDHNVTGAYNVAAAQRPQLRLVIHPEYEPYVRRVVNSQLISTGGSNPHFQNICQVDVHPALTAAQYVMFMNACGDPDRRAYLIQEREPLEIILFASREHISANHGMKILAYERFRMWYGEPRRGVHMTVS